MTSICVSDSKLICSNEIQLNKHAIPVTHSCKTEHINSDKAPRDMQKAAFSTFGTLQQTINSKITSIAICYMSYYQLELNMVTFLQNLLEMGWNLSTHHYDSGC